MVGDAANQLARENLKQLDNASGTLGQQLPAFPEVARSLKTQARHPQDAGNTQQTRAGVSQYCGTTNLCLFFVSVLCTYFVSVNVVSPTCDGGFSKGVVLELFAFEGTSAVTATAPHLEGFKINQFPMCPFSNEVEGCRGVD